VRSGFACLAICAAAALSACVETVAGQRRMVRSSHVFRERSEVVVEALAPPAAFGGLSRTVFDVFLQSMVIRPLPQ